MRRPKQDAGQDIDDTGLFSDDQFQASEFIGDMESHNRGARGGDDRSARLRLEERREDQWLRQQLSDWDDFDDFDIDSEDDPLGQDDFEPRV